MLDNLISKILNVLYMYVRLENYSHIDFPFHVAENISMYHRIVLPKQIVLFHSLAQYQKYAHIISHA